MAKKSFKVLSLYSGAGGLDEGLKQAGLSCQTTTVDLWADALRTNYINHPRGNDVNVSKVSDLKKKWKKGDFDIVIGGPPCPPFSNASGKYKTNDMAEVNLFIDIVKTVKPKYYLMENVPGLAKLLDWNFHWLVDMRDFGVGQARHRVIYTNLPYPVKQLKKVPKGKTLDKLFGLSEITSSTEGAVLQKSFEKGKRASFLTFRQPQDLRKHCKTITATRNNYDDYILDKETGYLLHMDNVMLAKVQGFPDNYKWHGSRTSLQRQIGNAVPPAVSKYFFKQIA